MSEVIYIVFHESGEYTSYDKSAIQVFKNKEDALKALETYSLELEQKKLGMQFRFQYEDESYFIEEFVIGRKYDYDIVYPTKIDHSIITTC
jgi:hypothetical protein